MRISDWSSDVCSSDLQPLGDRGLADARFADQHWIVLGPPCEHLDGAADFLVAADDGIELAVARRLGQVAGEFLKRVIAVLGGRGVVAASLAALVDRRITPIRLPPRFGTRRSDERRVWTACVSTCRSCGWLFH